MPNDPRVKFHNDDKVCRNNLAYLKTVSYTHLTLPTNREV